VARAALDLGAHRVRVVRVVPARAPGGGWAGGPEEAARTARLRALEAAAGRDGAVAVLLGHTLDDQAEQVLLGLARGSGARSLAGIPARRGIVVRPLLGLRRDVVRAACPRLPGLDLPWHDPSNDAAVPGAEALLRARVRGEVLPALVDVLGAAAVASLARSADLLREDADALDAWAERETAGWPGSRGDRPAPSTWPWTRWSRCPPRSAVGCSGGSRSGQARAR
jgi:tRNA(Ile)-lysidine synthase